MKAVILAGGAGTRFSEETSVNPKPMIEIGGRPILWHIMKIYSHHGVQEFIICCGHLGYVIKEYFANYSLHNSDVTFDVANHKMQVHQNTAEPWKVTLIDTGDGSGTGGRLRRVRSYLGDDDFCFTYGDGVADVDVSAVIQFHRAQGRLATLTSVQAQSRFGMLTFDDDRVGTFNEKPSGGWINGGFFVLSPKVIDYIESDETHWEHAPMRKLVELGQLSAYRHTGFWKSMDTLRDKVQLEALWTKGDAPWKVWTR